MSELSRLYSVVGWIDHVVVCSHLHLSVVTAKNIVRMTHLCMKLLLLCYVILLNAEVYCLHLTGSCTGNGWCAEAVFGWNTVSLWTRSALGHT